LTSRKSRRKRDRSQSSSRDLRRQSFSPPPTKKSRRIRKKDAVSRNRRRDGKVDCSSKNSRKSKTRPNSPHSRHGRGLSGRNQRSFSNHRGRCSDDNVRREVRHTSKSQSRRRVDSARRMEIRSPTKLPHQQQWQYQFEPRVNQSHPRLWVKNHQKLKSKCNERLGRTNFQVRRHNDRSPNDRLNINRQIDNRVMRFNKRLANLAAKGTKGQETNFNIKRRRGTSNHFSSKRKRVVNTLSRTKKPKLEFSPVRLPSNVPSDTKLSNSRFKEITFVSPSPSSSSPVGAKNSHSRKSSHGKSKSKKSKSDSQKKILDDKNESTKLEEKSSLEEIDPIELLEPEDKATRLKRILGPTLKILSEGAYGEKYSSFLKEHGLTSSSVPQFFSKHNLPKPGPRERRLNELLSLVGPVSEPLFGGTLIWSKSIPRKSNLESNSTHRTGNPTLAPLRPPIAMAQPKTEGFEEEYKEEAYQIFPKPKPKPVRLKKLPPAPVRTMGKDRNVCIPFSMRYQDSRRQTPRTSTLDFI